MTEVTVAASKTYKILIGENMLDVCGDFIKQTCGGATAYVICGDTVEKLYSEKVLNSLKRSGYITHLGVYPHGEQSKNSNTYITLLNDIAEKKLTRTDVIVALGGGVTGDLSGFLAATYMRGIKYVQIPTTLLAMVDSSVGGKTAIDLPAGKNLAGAFHQPELVLCDYSTLSTLPEETFKAGCAEVAKYAVLSEPELIDLLKEPKKNIEAIIEHSVSIKRDVVQNDEFDKGERQKLNLGHTVGHAIEKLSDFKLSHGQAVAAGMAIISRAAYANGECSEETVKAIEEILTSLDLPISTEYSADQLADVMLSDKKRSGSKINLIIPKKVGECIIKEINALEVKEYIEKGLSI